MTAFARESAATDQGDLTVELRSVNHRYLDCTFKLPDALRPLEQRLRELAGKAMARGKLDCLIRLQVHPTIAGELQVNPEQLDKLLAAAALISEKLPGVRQPSALDILQFPGICGADDHSEEDLQASAEALFRKAIANLVDNRRREGEKLAALVLDRLQQVESAVSATRQVLPALMQQQRDRIMTRIGELDIDVDQGRLEQELVHLAQKADVDEELDRLEAHIGEVRHILEKGGPCGRRLDFLMQELNREANTLSSKSTATSTTQSAVELKVLIEQMREQIQNIE
ncbi:MAG: YicC/YloC family endoribonuclease [Halieaceae bacterium]|nr:YicC/YloC family endoribonuclease [Halieaceae bacterium]